MIRKNNELYQVKKAVITIPRYSWNRHNLTWEQVDQQLAF